MERNIVSTADGSHTVQLAGKNEMYHSKYGAIQESKHVYINAGLKTLIHTKPKLSIFEMGFGTGLNALLTLIEAEEKKQPIFYQSIELFPLENEMVSQLNYCAQLNRPDLQKTFELIHFCEWEKEIEITPYFTIKKSNKSLLDFFFEKKFHLVYYDAFAPKAQPELWKKEIFENLYSHLFDLGVLVTYCSKGSVKRTLKEVGFKVEKAIGPPGKREMVRAIKIV